MLDDDGAPKTAEYQDGDVTVLSRAPLTGTLELMGDDDELSGVSASETELA
jgi:hypothetical protein